MTERFQQILRPQRTGCLQGGSPGSGSLGALPPEAGVTPRRARLLVRQISTRSRQQRNGACVPCLHSDLMGSDVGASVHPSAVLSHVRATHGTMQQDIEPCCIVAVCERQSPKGLIAAPWIRASVAESGVTPVTTRSAPKLLHPTGEVLRPCTFAAFLAKAAWSLALGGRACWCFVLPVAFDSTTGSR